VAPKLLNNYPEGVLQEPDVAARDGYAPAFRPGLGRSCIVMACTDISEADLVSRQLWELNNGCLVTYRRAEDIMFNAPAGKVALIILAASDTPAGLGRALRWLRRRWPRCPVTVVGDMGAGESEMAARKEAACYLTRPVSPEQWRAILAHVLSEDKTPDVHSRDRL